MRPFAALLALASAAPNAAVVVLPPESRGGDAAPWVAAAVADELPRALGLISVPAVERSDLLRAQEALGLPEGPRSRATGIRLAEALGASRVVTGTYTLAPAGVTLSLRLLDVERATLSLPLVASGPVHSLPDLLRSLAWDVAISGPTAPTRTREELAGLRPAVPFEAFQAYAQGLAAADGVSRVRGLQRALAVSPGYVEARIALGQARIEAGELAAARETLAAVPGASPLSRPARFLEGVALLRLGRYREASRIYETLAAAKPSAAVLNNLALAVARLGTSRGRPAQLLRQAMEAEPSASDLPFNLGWALLLEGEAEAAVFWLRSVSRRDPRDVGARVLLSWALRHAGREAVAAEEWQALLLASPSYQGLAAPDLKRRFERPRPSEGIPVTEGDDVQLAAAHMSRAEGLAAASDWDGALTELTRAAYLDPYSARVHHLLAQAHRARGDLDRAASELRMALWCREDAGVRQELRALENELGRPARGR